MLSNWKPVYRREVQSYINSPIAYGAALFFVAAVSVWFFFVQGFVARNQADLRPLFGLFPTLFIILIPALTMRIWAEEKKMKTDELLLTLPFSEGDLVMGKFLAAFTLLAVMIGLTLPVPLMVSRLGNFDPGQIAAQYLGSLLLGGAALAAGTFLSSVSRNQISAFLLTLVVMIVLTMASELATALSLPGFLGDLFRYLSLSRHFDSFSKGLVDTRDLIYYLLVGGFFLYLNYQQLIFRKWK